MVLSPLAATSFGSLRSVSYLSQKLLSLLNKDSLGSLRVSPAAELSRFQWLCEANRRHQAKTTAEEHLLADLEEFGEKLLQSLFFSQPRQRVVEAGRSKHAADNRHNRDSFWHLS